MVFRAEVQHFLGLPDAADGGPREGPASHDERERVDRERLGRCTNVDQGAVEGEQLQVGTDVDRGADRVDDQVERPGKDIKRTGIAGGVELVRAQPKPIFLLLQGLGEDRDLGTHGGCELDGHVPEAPKPDDGDLLAGSGTPVPQRGIRGDAGAQEGSGDVEVQAVRNADHKVFGHDGVG